MMTIILITIVILVAFSYLIFLKIRGKQFTDRTIGVLTIKNDHDEARRNEDELLEPTAYTQNKQQKIDYERPLDITETEQVDDNGVLIPPENSQ